MQHHRHDDDAQEWDRFYAGADDDAPHWSGEPNATLVTEVATLRPGRALDVGCGEGGDAVWLARQGWQVTAIDPSAIALRRGRALARGFGVAVTWIRAGLLELPHDPDGFDLVTAHYPVLPRGDGDDAMVALLRAVAPDGTLLFVHHELDAVRAFEHRRDPTVLVMPDSLAAHLDQRWVIEVQEARDHWRAELGEDSPRDVVLRARRRSDGAGTAP